MMVRPSWLSIYGNASETIKNERSRSASLMAVVETGVAHRNSLIQRRQLTSNDCQQLISFGDGRCVNAQGRWEGGSEKERGEHVDERQWEEVHGWPDEGRPSRVRG
jgi:hypothetical protein